MDDPCEGGVTPGTVRAALRLRPGASCWGRIEGEGDGRTPSGSTDGEGERGVGVSDMQRGREWVEENPESARLSLCRAAS